MPKRTDIKKSLILGSCPIAGLLGCLFVAAACLARPSVEVLMPQPSSQSPKITVFLGCSPAQHTKVDVSTADGKIVASLSADESGAVVLPRLRAGRYTIAAVAPGRLQAYLVLDISRHKSKQQSEFALQLQVGPPSFEEFVEGAEANATPDRIPEFNGTVMDPSGVAMANTKIYIYQRGSGGKTVASTAKTDLTGHFDANLPPGAYTAVFEAPGFRMKIHVFEIAADSPARETSIRLDLGAVTE